MKFLDTNVAPLGMGCWQIGGPMFMNGQPVGYAGSDDAESIRTVHAALDSGIRVFDTAAAYGAGHSERLLGEALRGRDAIIMSKIGMGIDEATKQVNNAETDAAQVISAIDRCLQRLGRDCVDVILLHLNSLPLTEALPIFDQLDAALQAGKIRGYGWSTDFSGNVRALDGRAGVVGIEHAMNVFFDAATLQATIGARDLVAFQRSPLAMGLLTGKYGAESQMAVDDVRAGDQSWLGYFEDGRPAPAALAKLAAVRELLQTGGRSLTQGAICWLWAKADFNMPVPGARTAAQITDTAGALAHGPLPADVMAQIETLIPRDPQDAERER